MTPAEALAAAGFPVARLSPLSGGCIAEVFRADLADGRQVAVKWSPVGGLAVEAFMLGRLAATGTVPVPEVLASEDRLLVLRYVEHGGALSAAGERQAGRLLAALHAVKGPHFGYDRDTVIGPLPQPNPPTARWVDFFRDHRLLPMADRAREAGRLPAATRARIDRLAARLGDWIGEPAYPALLHGDLWPGNVLAHRGAVAAFIDPAIYWGHPEMDLAFAGLFGGLGEDFLAGYGEAAPLAPGFREVRRDLCNLWPLLVHARLFGGSYAQQVDRIAARLVG
ncbi:MAG: fructosamine kinase family protein [Rhodospirillales bacterium]|nr:fructosamine kinase family protein [Rhodospirillales bacterium]